jgi:quercetin dioxygenase-like cupin family protein
MQPTLVKFSSLMERHLNIRLKGAAEAFVPDFNGAMVRDGIIHWDPGVDGIVMGESKMAADSEHGGERHLDSDEVLHLIAGRMRLSIEKENDQIGEIVLNPGDTVVVPRGYWHRLEIDEPSHFIFIGGGRTQVRLNRGETA